MGVATVGSRPIERSASLRRSAFAATLGASLALAGCEAKPSDPLEAVYAKRCAYCHKLDGEGTTSFPPLRQPYLKTQALTRIILHGMKGPLQVDGKSYDREMAGLGDTLSDAEVLQVIQHTHSPDKFLPFGARPRAHDAALATEQLQMHVLQGT